MNKYNRMKFILEDVEYQAELMKKEEKLIAKGMKWALWLIKNHKNFDEWAGVEGKGGLG